MSESTCPHCQRQPAASGAIALGILLGIGAVGCGDKDEDTGAADDTAVEEPASEPDMAAEYGVPAE
jgi:hypothetical protein